MGGLDPGIGWAGGIERLAMLAAADLAAPRPLALVPMGEAAERQAIALARTLRREGTAVGLAYRGNMQKRLKRANKVQAAVAVLIGDDELARGVATVRTWIRAARRASRSTA